MPTINLSWTPGSATTAGQRVSAIAKVNGATPNMLTGFAPANDMPSAQSSAVFTTNNFNIIYRFKVENLCDNGSVIPNTNGIKEQIVFNCIPIDVKAGDATDVSYTARILKGAYTFIDGTAYPNSISNIEGVEFSLHNSTNGALIQGPVAGTLVGSGSSEAFEHTFNSLSPGTSYTLKSVLLSTIDSIQVRSDSAAYLNSTCNTTVTTTGTGACSNYTVTNNSGATISFSYTTCQGAGATFSNLAPAASTNVCAIDNSLVLPPDVSAVEVGGCFNGNACMYYTLNPTGGNGASVSVEYMDCDGNPVSFTFNTPYSFCTSDGYNITQGSATPSGPAVFCT